MGLRYLPRDLQPLTPYGPLVESAVRVVTWNVWGRYGPAWETRQVALEDTLAEVTPDVICLVEAWRYGESSQPGRVASRRGIAIPPLRGRLAAGGLGVGSRPGLPVADE